MNDNNGQQSLNEILQGAIDAQNKGIPVNWQELCMTVYNVATNHIAQLEAQAAQGEETEAE